MFNFFKESEQRKDPTQELLDFIYNLMCLRGLETEHYRYSSGHTGTFYIPDTEYSIRMDLYSDDTIRAMTLSGEDLTINLSEREENRFMDYIIQHIEDEQHKKAIERLEQARKKYMPTVTGEFDELFQDLKMIEQSENMIRVIREKYQNNN